MRIFNEFVTCKGAKQFEQPISLLEIVTEVPVLTEKFLNDLADAGIGNTVGHDYTDADGDKWAILFTRIK